MLVLFAFVVVFVVCVGVVVVGCFWQAAVVIALSTSSAQPLHSEAKQSIT